MAELDMFDDFIKDDFEWALIDLMDRGYMDYDEEDEEPEFEISEEDEYHLRKAKLAILEYVDTHPKCSTPTHSDFPEIKSEDFEWALMELMGDWYLYCDDEETEFEIGECGKELLKLLKEQFDLERQETE